MTQFVDNSLSYLLHMSERAPLHISEMPADLLQDTPIQLYHQLSVPHHKNVSFASVENVFYINFHLCKQEPRNAVGL